MRGTRSDIDPGSVAWATTMTYVSPAGSGNTMRSHA